MPGGARLGDIAKCPADGHGCKACTHSVQGPAVQGSPNVTINGQPAVRVGDRGIHAGCCGPNTWTAAEGSATVFINGRPAVRIGDRTAHCGGSGNMAAGSSDVIIGDGQARLFSSAAKSHAPFVRNIQADQKRADQAWEQNMAYLEEKGCTMVASNNKVPENFIQRNKRKLKTYLDDRGTQKYSEGHYVAAFIDAIGSTMLDDIPETTGMAAVGIVTDLAFGKALKIGGKGVKLLYDNLDTLSEPVQKRARAILQKLESGKKLTQADNNVLTEAVGEIGGQKALARQGISNEPGFVNRYHGPDHMGRDVDGNLVETEFKGSAKDSTQIPANAEGKKQLSRDSNKKRSQRMIKKAPKVDKPSNRIGGPYNQGEIQLWDTIEDVGGQKKLISTHTNIETGAVKVFERNPKGKIINQMDTFNVYAN